jgi:hypothetical protein
MQTHVVNTTFSICSLLFKIKVKTIFLFENNLVNMRSTWWFVKKQFQCSYRKITSLCGKHHIDIIRKLKFSYFSCKFSWTISRCSVVISIFSISLHKCIMICNFKCSDFLRRTTLEWCARMCYQTTYVSQFRLSNDFASGQVHLEILWPRDSQI